MRWGNAACDKSCNGGPVSFVVCVSHHYAHLLAPRFAKTHAWSAGPPTMIMYLHNTAPKPFDTPYPTPRDGDAAIPLDTSCFFQIAPKRVSVSDTIRYDTTYVPFPRGGEKIKNRFLFWPKKMLTDFSRYNGYF